MIDKRKKTEALMAALKMALPFEADLTPEAAARMPHESGTLRRAVTALHYMGDEGGIMCAIESPDKKQVFLFSLTHLRMLPAMPLAAAVSDYQRRRVRLIGTQARM